MTRPERVFLEGVVYHVYNRLARGERVFDEETTAGAFVDLVREVAQRDELTVLAWCLMGNHYHLAVRTGAVPLYRPMRSLQRRVTRHVNLRGRVYGPLWQGRYRAKLVRDERYLLQLIAYIHLNPVSANLADDPASYRWSGHGEILGTSRQPIIDVDEVLQRFGRTRRSARAAYMRMLRGLAEEPWLGEGPGRLPWWRLGRPVKEENEDPEVAVQSRAQDEIRRPQERPTLPAAAYIERGSRALGVSVDELRGRLRRPEAVRAREALVVVGVERYGLKVKDLAREMGKSPDSMTKAIVRATQRRATSAELRPALDELDRLVAAGAGSPNNGGTA
jgi:putative transposase